MKHAMIQANTKQEDSAKTIASLELEMDSPLNYVMVKMIELRFKAEPLLATVFLLAKIKKN